MRQNIAGCCQKSSDITDGWSGIPNLDWFLRNKNMTFELGTSLISYRFAGGTGLCGAYVSFCFVFITIFMPLPIFHFPKIWNIFIIHLIHRIQQPISKPASSRTTLTVCWGWMLLQKKRYDGKLFKFKKFSIRLAFFINEIFLAVFLRFLCVLALLSKLEIFKAFLNLRISNFCLWPYFFATIVQK